MATITAAKPGDEATADDAGGGKKKKLIMVVVGVLLLAGAAYWFLLKPGDAAEPEVVPGEVVALEPIQINLADGHYLRVGIALQTVEGAYEVDGSYALDKLISTFSMVPMQEVADAEKREKHREYLVEQLDEHYQGDVMDVYFTEFVTQ